MKTKTQNPFYILLTKCIKTPFQLLVTGTQHAPLQPPFTSQLVKHRVHMLRKEAYKSFTSVHIELLFASHYQFLILYMVIKLSGHSFR